jgi:hypothetical protein
MTMTLGLRKFALTAHITFSVGWLGAVVAYLALAIACLTSRDAQAVRSGYLAMELTGWFVIVPLSLASLLSGLVQSLGTEWGLFRYYWVLVKFVLTMGATTILLLHMPVVSRMSGAASEVVHAGGGLLVLVAATTLSVYKPWGRIGSRRRGQHETRKGLGPYPAATPGTARGGADTHLAAPQSQLDSNNDADVGIEGASTPGTRWGLYVLLGTVCIVLLIIVLHLVRGRHHGH